MDPSPPTRAVRARLVGGLKLAALIGAVLLAFTLPAFLSNSKSDAKLTADIASTPAPAAVVPPVVVPKFADFKGHAASPEAIHVANWVVDASDSHHMPFVIIDKRNAQVHVFDAQGALLGSSPVLLGSAHGDDSVKNIGERPIAQVRPEERTTPAGRFVTEPGRNATGEDVIWVDYDAAVSMHRVRATNPKERRLERLATATSDDNRISYGCINVPVAFFEGVLSPTLKQVHAIAYVLPETGQSKRCSVLTTCRRSTAPQPCSARSGTWRQADATRAVSALSPCCLDTGSAHPSVCVGPPHGSACRSEPDYGRSGANGPGSLR